MIAVHCSECQCVKNSKQARVNDRRNHDSHDGCHVCTECQSGSKHVISVQCSEGQSGEKTGAGKRQEPNVSTSVDVAVWLESTMNRVSDGDRSTLFSFLTRGAGQGYAPQSGEIIGILKQLMADQKEEEVRKANHAGLIAAKKEEIATLIATIETKLTQQGYLAVEVESLKNDVADTQRSLAAGQGLAAKLAESCSSHRSGRSRRAGLEKARLVNLARHTLFSLRSTSVNRISPDTAIQLLDHKFNILMTNVDNDNSDKTYTNMHEV